MLFHSQNRLVKKSLRGHPGSGVAVCFSGFLRTFHATWPVFNDRMGDYNPDIFISTWDVLGHAHYKHSTGREGEKSITPEILDQHYGERLKGFSIRKMGENVLPPWIMAGDYDLKPPMDRVASMYYHIFAANELRTRFEQTHRHQYQIVIRCRPDIILETDAAHWINGAEYAQRAVNVPYKEDYGIVNDQMMYGRPEPMNIVADLFNAMYRKHPSGVMTSRTPILPSEALLKHYMDYHGIAWQPFRVLYHRT